MTYEELREHALKCSLEHHLSSTVEELLSEDKTVGDILIMVEENNDDIIVYEPYEFYEPSSLAEAIEDMRGVRLYEFMQVLTMVNGEEWATNFKEGKQQ